MFIEKEPVIIFGKYSANYVQSEFQKPENATCPCINSLRQGLN